jgi:hypothetical protein
MALDVYHPDGCIDPEKLAAVVGVTATELASTFGFPSVTAIPPDRLRELLEIITLVTPWTGSAPQAFAWYRSQPIPSFDGRTAEELVREGRSEVLMSYLNRISQGGYA